MSNQLLVAALLITNVFARDRSAKIKPSAEVPTAFAAQAETAGTTAKAAEEEWWVTLGDPQLNALIGQAMEGNLNLKAAAERLLEARAARSVSRADLLPSVGTSTSFQRLRGGFQSGNIFVGNKSGATSLISPFETTIFRPGFDASWELDFFGGKRKAFEAATADVQVSEEDYRGMIVSLLGEVAGTYAELRGKQRQLAITKRNISIQRDSLTLTQVRADAGLGNRLDVERQQTQLE